MSEESVFCKLGDKPVLTCQVLAAYMVHIIACLIEIS